MSQLTVEVIQEGPLRVVEVLQEGPRGATGPAGGGGLTMTAGILGRESGTGAPQVLTLGSGLSIINGALTATGGGAGSGTVTSVALSAPLGFVVNSSPITSSGTLALSYATGYSLPTTASQSQWDTAYSERNQWNGGVSGLVPATGRASLGLGSAATSNTTDFATAAQGALAATAVQPAALALYVQSSDSRLSDSREWSATTVTQADAEAGVATARVAWTVQRVWQAITAWWSASSAKAKLDGIAAGATANSSDATLLNRANHTGTQAASTISDSTTAGRALLTATDATAQRTALGLGTLATQSGTFSGTSSGTNTGDQTIANTSDATSHTITLSASGGSVQFVEGSNITLTTTGTSGAGVVTISATGGGGGGGGGDAQTGNPLSQFAATTSAQFFGVISDETGTGLVVGNNGPTLIAPILGIPASGTLTNCTGLPVSTGISGLGTGIAAALAINTGSAGAPVLLGGAGGTPSSLTLTNATGLPWAAGITGKPTTLSGYGITDAQPLDSDLTAIAALTTTSFGRSFLDRVDAAAGRTLLGLGSLATQSGTFSGTSSGTNTGDQTITLTGDVTGSGTSSFAATLSATAVVAGSYGSGSQVGTFTVDAKGRLTAAGSVTISIASTAISDSTAAGRTLLTGANAAAQLASLGAQKAITSGTAPPSGGADGDIYLQYTP